MSARPRDVKARAVLSSERQSTRSSQEIGRAGLGEGPIENRRRRVVSGVEMLRELTGPIAVGQPFTMNR